MLIACRRDFFVQEEKVLFLAKKYDKALMVFAVESVVIKAGESKTKR